MFFSSYPLFLLSSNMYIKTCYQLYSIYLATGGGGGTWFCDPADPWDFPDPDPPRSDLRIVLALVRPVPGYNI